MTDEISLLTAVDDLRHEFAILPQRRMKSRLSLLRKHLPHHSGEAGLRVEALEFQISANIQ
jgi:hypothetical protein